MEKYSNGNPFNIDAVMQLAEEHDLWVIEDNCDAFGSEYRGKKTGNYAHFPLSHFTRHTTLQHK